ncbi:MAG: ABC transporter ATP-binding protein [Micrococcaceae bacterium]
MNEGESIGRLSSAGAVVFNDVTKRYADGTEAVSGLHLTCKAGEITVFVGPSGCGKTTSLRMINRMIEPTSGQITIGDSDVLAMDENQLRRGIGYVIQNAGLFPHRTIIDNIATVPRLIGHSRKEARERAWELLSRVGLDSELGKKFPYQLSGGQQQRVGVARALASDPPVLLMDEPFSAVDPVVRLELQDELLRLQQTIRKTIIFVTHDMDEAIRIADRIVVFQRGGVIAQEATPEEILMAPASAFVRDFTGDSGIKWLSTVSTEGLRLDDFSVRGVEEAQALPGWSLTLDESRSPVGWQPPETTGSEARIPCRRTFVTGEDQLRVAFDSALLSPIGLAVAVNQQQEFMGVTRLNDIEALLSARRENARV